MITIKVERDESCEMARVYDSIGNGMEGNFWDFHNGCHGLYEFGNFNTVDEFSHALKNFHELNGEEVKIINKKYKYQC